MSKCCPETRRVLRCSFLPDVEGAEVDRSQQVLLSLSPSTPSFNDRQSHLEFHGCCLRVGKAYLPLGRQVTYLGT